MAIQKILISFLFLVLTQSFGFSQTKTTIDSLKVINQACLDKGWHMPSCEYQYYVELDSILNVVYGKLMLKLNASDKETLKKEQLQWLKQRDAIYQKSYKEYEDSVNAGMWGTEMRVIPIGDKADFTEKRVLILIKRLQLYINAKN